MLSKFFIGFLIMNCSAFASELPHASEVGEIHFHGKHPKHSVTVSENGVKHDAFEGEPLRQGERLKNTSTTAAIIELKDQSKIALARDSEISVSDFRVSDKSRHAEIELKNGLAHFQVAKSQGSESHFLIRTQTTFLGVRGTEFVVGHDESDGTSLHTLDGSVRIARSREELSDPTRSHLVNKGWRSFIRPGADRPTLPEKFHVKAFLKKLSGVSSELGDYVSKMRARAQNVERKIESVFQKKR